ncbi:UDP-glucuronosyltransferase [Aphelenchoides bicaudatus]|nr:UDP-glucuronosyltransferase [Aphelenchoides bicaudatus]
MGIAPMTVVTTMLPIGRRRRRNLDKLLEQLNKFDPSGYKVDNAVQKTLETVNEIQSPNIKVKSIDQAPYAKIEFTHGESEMLLSKLAVMNAFLLFLLLIQNVSAYRYLMTTLNVAYSHLEFNGRVADLLDFLLAKVNPFAASNGTSKADVIEFIPPNLQEIGQLISQLPVYDDVFKEDVDVFSPNALPYFKKAAHLFCLALQSDKQLLSRLQEHKYDAALVEDDSCFKVLARRLGIRNLMILTPTALSEMHANALNIPALPSFVPGSFLIVLPRD